MKLIDFRSLVKQNPEFDDVWPDIRRAILACKTNQLELGVLLGDAQSLDLREIVVPVPLDRRVALILALQLMIDQGMLEQFYRAKDIEGVVLGEVDEPDQFPEDPRLVDFAAAVRWSSLVDPAPILENLKVLRSEYPRKTEQMEELCNQLVALGVYPEESGIGRSPLTMVESYGVDWYLYSQPHFCQHCQADLRDHEHGPPFSRKLGIYDRDRDMTVEFRCPDCDGVLSSRR